MILSIDEEKAFDKIQYLFMIKALKKLGIEGMFLNITIAIYNKPIASSITKWRTTETIPDKVRNETGMPTFPTPIQYSFRIPPQNNKTRERNKRTQVGKE
jgi:hypothetical protein